MKEIDEFLHFLLENESDDRIKFSKKSRYGSRNYYVTFNADSGPEEPRSMYNWEKNTITIIIDNRNCCVELTYDSDSKNIIIEDKKLLDKWSKILEEHINKDINITAKEVIEKTLSYCYNKNLHRSFQMKKILPNDESL